MYESHHEQVPEEVARQCPRRQCPGSVKRILALDGYEVNPGDVNWTPIEQLGEFTAIPHYAWDAVEAHATGAHVVLTDSVVFDADQFDRFPALEFLGLFATGYDRIDLDTARRRGIAVANVPGYSHQSVSQLTISLILSLAHQVPAYDRLVHSGGWHRDTPFTYLHAPLVELAGKGDRRYRFWFYWNRGGARGRCTGNACAWMEPATKRDTRARRRTWRPWEELLHESDVVTLHLPLNGGNAPHYRRHGAFNDETGKFFDKHVARRSNRRCRGCRSVAPGRSRAGPGWTSLERLNRPRRITRFLPRRGASLLPISVGPPGKRGNGASTR